MGKGWRESSVVRGRRGTGEREERGGKGGEERGKRRWGGEKDT